MTRKNQSERSMGAGMELTSFFTLRLFLLTFARCAGTVWFAPVFGGVEISRLNKLTCALLLSFLVFPSVAAGSDPSVSRAFVFNAGNCVLLALSLSFELLLGAGTGLFLKIFFQGVYLAGETISRIGGVSVAESFDPSLGGETTAPASFLFWAMLATFVACGGFEAFLDGFLHYFSVVAPGAGLSPSELVVNLTGALSSAFVLGLRLSAPVIIATALVYLCVGMSGRLFSQLNLYAISFNVNAILTLVLLFLCIGVFCQVFQSELASVVEKFFGARVA